jgi:predicted kinase
LKEGRGVILDATFKLAVARQRVLSLARQLGVPSLFVECVAPKSEVIRRLGLRDSIADEVSDATVEVYGIQEQEFEPLSDLEEHQIIDTTRDPMLVALELETALERAVCSTQSL